MGVGDYQMISWYLTPRSADACQVQLIVLDVLEGQGDFLWEKLGMEETRGKGKKNKRRLYARGGSVKLTLFQELIDKIRKLGSSKLTCACGVVYVLLNLL